MSGDLSIDVVVPSYGRPDFLARCLVGLREQEAPPASVVVVARPDDDPTHESVASFDWPRVRLITVTAPGMIAAMQRGAAASTGSIVAFTDDDAVPRTDWLARMQGHFSDERIGAVGGLDFMDEDWGGPAVTVGRLTAYGRLVGDHHRGIGAPRDVDVLKGVNMAFRADLLAFARVGVLRGDGAQPYNEPLMCRRVQQCGFRVVYDPALVVDHFPAIRVSGDHRGAADRRLVSEATHNFMVSTCGLDRGRIPRQALFAALVGDPVKPGLLRSAYGLARREPAVAGRLAATLAGVGSGVVTLARTGREDVVVGCDELRRLA